MSLKSKIEAVIYASEEPVTLQQLAGLLAGEAQAELDAIASGQGSLPLEAVGSHHAAGEERVVLEAGDHESVPPAGTEHEPQAAPQKQTVDAGDESGSEQQPSDQVAAEAPAQADAPLADAEDDKRRTRDRERAVREHIRRAVDELIRDYAENDRGIEIREVASGFRMGTKPEYHDAVRGFVKSLKPALKLTLPALETLAVVAYKQPVTAAEISEIRGVDSAGVLGGLMTRKLIATAGRKQVIGRPMLYKTTRDFLLRFGLKDVHELPSMEEFERMAGELAEQEDLPMENAETLIEHANARGDAEHIRDANAVSEYAGTLQAQSGASENDDTSNQEATAESAAGGNDEKHTRSTQPGAAQAETLQPSEASEHAESADPGSGEERETVGKD